MAKIKIITFFILIFIGLNISASELKFKELQTVNAHPASIISCDYNSEDYFAIASPNNQKIKIYLQKQNKFIEEEILSCVLYPQYPTSVKFSPDNQQLISGHWIGDVILWNKSDNWNTNENVLTGKNETLNMNFKDVNKNETANKLPVRCIDISPNGNYLVAGGKDKSLKIWVKTDTTFSEFQMIKYSHSDDIRDIDFNSKGNYFATSGNDGIVNIWKKGNEKFSKFQTITTDSEEIRCVSFSYDDKYLLAGDSENNLLCWKFEDNSFNRFQKIKEHSDKINCISFSPNNNYFAVASSDNTISIWKIANDKLVLLNKLFKHKNKVTDISFNKKGSFLTSVDLDGVINIWKFDNNTISFHQQIDNNLYEINSLSFHPNGKLLVSAGEDNYIKLWEIQENNLLEFQKIKIDSGPIEKISFSPDGEFLISLAIRKGIINIWEKEGNKYSKSDIFKDDVGNNSCFTFSQSNNYFALGYSKGVEIYKYSQQKFDKIYNLTYNVSEDSLDKFVKDIAFTPDGSTLAVAHNDNTISLWDINKKEYKKEIVVADSNNFNIGKISYSSKGNYLFIVSDKIFGNKLKIYKKSDNFYYEYQSIGIGFGTDTIIGLSPIENYFVLGYLNGSVILMENDFSKFEPKMGESVKPDTISYSKSFSYSENVIFSPDGEHLVCTTEDGLLRLFQISGLIIPIDQFIRIKLAPFLEKDEYETTNEHNNRINKYLDYKTQEIVNYALDIGYKLKIESISSYNADKKTYLINFQNCNQANAFVPRKFAKDFKDNINKLEVRNPQIKLVNDNLVITYAEIINPGSNQTFIVGEKSFFHEIEKPNNEIEDKIFYSVDIDIPISKEKKKNALAVIIGIENYRNISNVNYAYRDASFINEYFIKTIGIPEEQIYLKINEEATLGEFNKIFSTNGWLEKRIKKNKTDIYIYYAGHGAPAIKEEKAFLIPFDGDPNYPIQTGYSLETMLKNLSNLNANSVTVFLDACFTGANRENEMLLADARPVSIQLKNNYVNNVTVFSATSNNEISSSYPKNKHGLFSYFLMKGMQGEADTNKDNKLTINELFDYTKKNVSKIAGTLDREQTPQLECLEPEKIIINYQD